MGNQAIQVAVARRREKALPSPEELFAMINVDESFGFRTKDLEILYESFDSIDVDGLNYIVQEQLVKKFKVVETPFVRRVFRIFDHDGNNRIDFREYAITIWTYCAMAGQDLHVFAFDLYDVDGSGFIEKEEVHVMLSDMYGDDFTKKDKAMLIMDQLTAMEADMGGSPLITVEGWKEFLRFHGTMLFPAFRFQKRLREKVKGRRYWEKQSRRRQSLSETAQRFPRLHVARERALAAARAAGEDVDPPPPSPVESVSTPHDPKYGKLKSPSSHETNYKKLKKKQRGRKQTIAPFSSDGKKVLYPYELPGTGLQTPVSGSDEELEEADDISIKITFKDVCLDSIPASADLTRVKKISSEIGNGVIIRSTPKKSFSEYEKGNIIRANHSTKNTKGKKNERTAQSMANENFFFPKSNNQRNNSNVSSSRPSMSSYASSEDLS